MIYVELRWSWARFGSRSRLCPGGDLPKLDLHIYPHHDATVSSEVKIRSDLQEIDERDTNFIEINTCRAQGLRLACLFRVKCLLFWSVVYWQSITKLNKHGFQWYKHLFRAGWIPFESDIDVSVSTLWTFELWQVGCHIYAESNFPPFQGNWKYVKGWRCTVQGMLEMFKHMVF